MSIAIITIRQDDGEEELHISCEFSPDLRANDEEHPLTHLAALSVIEHLQEKLGDGTEELRYRN